MNEPEKKETAAALIDDWRKLLTQAVDTTEQFTKDKPLVALAASFTAGIVFNEIMSAILQAATMSSDGGQAAPRVDELIARTQKFVVDTLQESIEKPVGRVGRRLGGRLVRFALGTTLLTFAAGFLLFGFMSMLTLWLPLFGACLLAGGFALLLGLLFIKL